ncbi:sulfatase-like hydrolase/transferase [Paenibacillus sp. 1P07SE]|uniref:sulfatase-like hydrolase/transferase n=1 Tax=Paenibacillus sp. 1P07SE TaxID=3132209 RepID=UPI0039A54560
MGSQAKRPHLILFNPDQWRGDALGHLGHPAVQTPNLDRLVGEDAVSFRNAFCQNPVCTPSRCSFMSGWYPHVRGHRTMFHMMKPDEPVLLKHLKDAGYYVWWGGKNDLVPQDNVAQYCNHKNTPSMPCKPMYAMDRLDEWRGGPDSDGYRSLFAGKLESEPAEADFSCYPDSDWGHIRDALRFLAEAPADQPFCLYLPLVYPHPPYGVEEPWYSLTDRRALPPRIRPDENWGRKPSMVRELRSIYGLAHWEEERWDELRATYFGMCARVDYQLGLLIQALKQHGLYEDTALFVFSDHGDFNGDYDLVEKTQNTFEDCLTRVPFIVKPPAWIDSRPGVSDALVELVDLPATVADITGLPLAYTQFGKSLVPLLSGREQEHRDAVFSEGGRLREEQHCMDSTPQNNRVEDLYWPRGHLHRSSGPEHTKATMCRTKSYKYVRRLYEDDELYDLKRDPQELVNVAGDPAYREPLAQLKERMLRFYQETSDAVPWQRDQRDAAK